MKKFTKRDFKFFFLGVLAMIAVETIYDWDGFKGNLKKGWHDGANHLNHSDKN